MTLYRFVTASGKIDFASALDAQRFLVTLPKNREDKKLQAFDERPPAEWRDFESGSTDAFFNGRHDRRAEGNR